MNALSYKPIYKRTSKLLIHNCYTISINKSNNSSALPTESLDNAEMALRLFYSTLDKLNVKGVDGKGRLKINLPHTVSMERRIQLLHMLRMSRKTTYKHWGSNPPPRSPSSIKSKGTFLSTCEAYARAEFLSPWRRCLEF